METIKIVINFHAKERAKERNLEQYLNKRFLRTVLLKKGIFQPIYKKYRFVIDEDKYRFVFEKNENCMILITLFDRTKKPKSS